MQTPDLCQSCGMPLESDEMRGTEKNGSLSKAYCKYCYREGALINPGMTLDEMRDIVTSEMKKRSIPESVIEAAVLRLPFLERWKGTALMVEEPRDRVR